MKCFSSLFTRFSVIWLSEFNKYLLGSSQLPLENVRAVSF